MFVALITALLSFPFDTLYWIKWILTYLVIRLHNATHRKRFDLYQINEDGDPEKLAFLIPQLEIDLESPQSEKRLQESADEITFYGVNSKAECIFVRISRDVDQEAEAVIYLKMTDGSSYLLTDHVNYQQPFEGKCMIFSSGNLQMYYLLPMRKWRIQYCGPLTRRSNTKDTCEETVFVKFVFLWNASSDAYDPTLDTNPHGLASAVAKSKWETYFSPSAHRLSQSLNFYSQMGNLRGSVTIDEGIDYVMDLFGEKTRNLGSLTSGSKFENIIGYVPLNGFGIHLTKSSASNLFEDFPLGFVTNANGDIDVIKYLDISRSSNDANSMGNYVHASFTSGLGSSYELNGSILESPVEIHIKKGWNKSLKISFITFSFINKTGYGLLLSEEVYNEPRKASLPMVRTLHPKTVPLTVKFNDEISHFGDISGGKGSSLGKLTKLSKRDKTFDVPKGIIVTTTSYEVFLTANVLNAIKRLENIAYGNIKGDVKKACEEVGKSILSTALPEKISQSIIEELKFLFGVNFTSRMYAVRSSATGEDTETMSAAGQMETYLGVQGLKDIFQAVKKCWASQFGYIAVEYKRQNGQILNSPMAVVIQEMIPCEISGVLFTCDPVNNNPHVISIAANHGLGESVVSGSVEPDTIMLLRGIDDSLQIKSVNVGSKHQKIILKESGGTIAEILPDDSKITSCVKEETVFALGMLGIKIEKFYKSSRDIEWGIFENKIYLFQARPITSGSCPTEFEIKHEFDSFLRSEREYFTKANVGEAMPGSISPLGGEIGIKLFNHTFAKLAFKKAGVDTFSKSHYYASLMKTFYYQYMMSVPELICRHGHGTIESIGFCIGIFGRMVDNPEIHEVARERFPYFPKATLREKIMYLKDQVFCIFGAQKLRKRVDSYEMAYLRHDTSEETFDALMKTCTDFQDVLFHHMECSDFSSYWNFFLLLILAKGKGSFDTDVYSDFGKLLATSSNLESADIPSSMQKVADQIRKDLGSEKFKAMNLEDAEKWLKTSKTLSCQMYHDFLTRHGHRCLKEFDIYVKPWGQDQKMFIKLLQTLTGCSREVTEKQNESDSKTIAELRVSLKYWHRLLLRVVIPLCRKGIRAREFSKSMMIKCIDYWRKGYQHLSKLMVAEGRIPDEELIYFMSLDEIRFLLKTRYPKIISRAIQRRKIFPVVNKYEFPDIIRGYPKPLNEEQEEEFTEYTADLTMQGIPVSQGVTKGYVRVATSLKEAENIKPGEILIAIGTDIGWSPYFPIISGVVTELGGLISHGAVVSREYGLPCVIGLKGATKKFKTGDYVLLDGKKGVLQRLPKPED